jgi:hypothetical protein
MPTRDHAVRAFRGTIEVLFAASWVSCATESPKLTALPVGTSELVPMSDRYAMRLRWADYSTKDDAAEAWVFLAPGPGLEVARAWPRSGPDAMRVSNPMVREDSWADP